MMMLKSIINQADRVVILARYWKFSVVQSTIIEATLLWFNLQNSPQSAKIKVTFNRARQP